MWSKPSSTPIADFLSFFFFLIAQSFHQHMYWSHCSIIGRHLGQLCNRVKLPPLPSPFPSLLIKSWSLLNWHLCQGRSLFVKWRQPTIHVKEQSICLESFWTFWMMSDEEKWDMKVGMDMLRRGHYYNLFFLWFKNYFWPKKKGNDVMNKILTISQITISNKLLSKIFLHIFIVMGTLKWLWNCLAEGFNRATKELIPTSQDSNRAIFLHNFSKHLVLWVVFFFFSDKFFDFLEKDNFRTLWKFPFSYYKFD